jgi:restriction system protein
VDAEVKVWLASFKKGPKTPEGHEEEDGTEETLWKNKLITRLLGLPPQGFEQLTQRILREAGFVNVIVTGKSGDGGIDGTGTYRISLVSFPVYFQCKRYRGSVPASAVRDFRGAMAGKGENGLLITTGSFTAAAKEEATKAGAAPIDLIDGERLCDLLCDYRLGVEVTERVEKEVTVNTDFFNDYDKAT